MSCVKSESVEQAINFLIGSSCTGVSNETLRLSFRRFVGRCDEIFVGGTLCPYTEHAGEIGNIYVIVGMQGEGLLREYMLDKNGELYERRYPNF